MVHLWTFSSSALHSMTNQWIGLELSVPQISHRYCVTAAMVNPSRHYVVVDEFQNNRNGCKAGFSLPEIRTPIWASLWDCVAVWLWINGR